MSPYEHLLLGQILTTQIRLPAEALEAALKQQDADERERDHARKLGEILIERRLASAEQINSALNYQREQFSLALVGPYRMESMLGRGGTGTVYRAVQLGDRREGRSVALKLLSQRKSGDVESLARFQREAQAGLALDHPAIVRTLDFGTTRDAYYLVYPLMTGGTLSDRVRIHGPMLEIEVLDLAVTMLQALDYASARGLVHRDIKPANILYNEHDRPHLADLGLAQLITSAKDGGPSDRTAGTPAFIAPEQALGQERNDVRSDLYSLGATLFFALSGTPPFAEKRSVDAINRHLNDAPPALDKLGISAHTTAVVRKLMAKRVEDRYATPAEATADVRRVQAGERPLAMALSPEQAYAPLKVNVQKRSDDTGTDQLSKPNTEAKTTENNGHRLSTPTGKAATKALEPSTDKHARQSAKRREPPNDRRAKSVTKEKDPATDATQRSTHARNTAERPGAASRTRPATVKKSPLLLIGAVTAIVLIAAFASYLLFAKSSTSPALTENISDIENDSVPEPVGTTLDLMSLLNLDELRDADWLSRDGVLMSPRGAQRLLLAPYLPPTEYDLTCSFKRLYPSGSISLLFDFSGRNVSFIISGDENMRTGFELVDKGDMTINGTELINPEPLAPDKRITVTIQVRRSGMTALVNTKEVAHLSTSGQGLTIDPKWEMPTGHVLGIGMTTTQIALFRWKLIEVSGSGSPIIKLDSIPAATKPSSDRANNSVVPTTTKSGAAK